MHGTKKNPPADTIRDDIEALRVDAMRLRDELRLQLHLGGMEAKDAFVVLEDRFVNAEAELEHKGKEASVQMKRAWQELRDAFATIRRDVDKTAPSTL